MLNRKYHCHARYRRSRTHCTGGLCALIGFIVLLLLLCAPEWLIYPAIIAGLCCAAVKVIKY